MGTAYYFLKNKGNGNVVDVARGSNNDGALLIAYPPKTPPQFLDNQLWELVLSDTPPYYFIASKQTELVIDVIDELEGLPLAVKAKTPSRIDNQLWMLVPADETQEYFFIVSKLIKGDVITVGTTEGGPLPLVASPRKTSDTDDQLWSFVRYG